MFSEFDRRCCCRMDCSLLTPSFFLSLGILLHSGRAQVLTESQTGPLYRVQGSRLSITCNVSGFPNPNTAKHFEFRFLPPANPSSPLNVISTRTDAFGYAVFSRRVRSGDITLTYGSPDSVVFEIQRLQKADEGEFDCLVINPEGARYIGKYSDTTELKVIDDSLSVSSPDSLAPSYDEGEALALSCLASSNTLQHTHLSLGWYLHKSGEDASRLIVSLNRDFTLTAGRGFEERHRAGLIRLDKVGEATYHLQMAKLEVSDQGEIYCRAQEWIQDPDRSWYSIAQKESARRSLTVAAREVRPSSSQVTARLSLQPSSLQEGQELSLTCSIDTATPEATLLSVAWTWGGVEVARIGPTGILSVGLPFVERDKDGDFRAARVSSAEYRLTLKPVRTQDQGQYRCIVQPQERGEDGALALGEEQRSNSVTVTITARESGLWTLEMASSATVQEGHRLELTCKVHGISGQLSVSWQRKSAHAAGFTGVGGLNQEGVLEDPLTGRRVSVARPAADTFTLELEEMTVEDSGVYQCVVSKWKTSSKTNSLVQSATVTVVPIESFVLLGLSSRGSVATVGDVVELVCRVRGLNTSVTVTWTLQRDGSSLDSILTVYSNGDISWAGEQHNYQLRVQKESNGHFYYLVINGVSPREAGRYQCHVGVPLKNGPKKLESNSLTVVVLKPVSKLTLSPDPSLRRYANTDVEMKCSVTSATSAASRYAVTWLLAQQGENVTLLNADQDGLLTFGSTLAPNHSKRISARRSSGPTFQLSIRQAQASDQGDYVCEVVEWQQASKNQWFPLPTVAQTIQLTLTEPANDLRVNLTHQWAAASEGDDVKLECNIVTGAFTPSLFYAVSWLYSRKDPSGFKTLVELDHTGLLTYPQVGGLGGLQGRLRLSRPTQSSFNLHIQRSHEEDGGMYQCCVEQFSLADDGQWQRKASESAGPVVLKVKVAGKNLSLLQEEVELNVSASQDFTLPCQITRQSSVGSQFQVTWFFQKDPKQKQEPIFRVDTNSTLQFRVDDKLRFSRPSPKDFHLTLLNLDTRNSGVYFCEVEEWVPSLTHGWRNVTVERSGNYNISVYTEGGNAEQQCQSSTFLGILVPIILLLLFVIFLLVLKLCRSNGEAKKPRPSLWTEQHPLNCKLSAEG